MREIINTFEQFCKKLDKNIIVEERILNDGKRILKCHGCTAVSYTHLTLPTKLEV